MFNRVIVPVDGSDHAWRAAEVGATLARQCAAELELLEVVESVDDAGAAEESIAARAAFVDLRALTPIVTALPLTAGESVAMTIAAHVGSILGSIIVVSSAGRGRAEALVGSVAEELLGEMFGPVIVVGPHAVTDRVDFRRPIVVPVDGSENAESILGLAAALGIGLEARPWVVEVIAPDGERPPDMLDSSYPASVARRLQVLSQHPADFEVLHDTHPDRAIGGFAAGVDASLIVASTHGRTGLARFAVGSRAMGIVRHAPCPVVLVRPPKLRRVTETVLTAQPLEPVVPRRPLPPQASGAALDPESGLVRAAVVDLAARLGVDPSTIEVVDARSVTWPDNSLGCPEPGMMYVQRLVDGALVVLEGGGRRYEYHGGNPLKLCEHPHPPAGR